MRSIFKAIVVSILIITFNCTSEEPTVIENLDSIDNILKAPNNIMLENSLEILGEKLTGKREGIEILDISYIEGLPKDFTGLIANVQFTDNGEFKEVMIIRDIYEIKFEKGTVIQFNENNRSSVGDGDIYISCSGSEYCYPSGTYDPNTGLITTSCKCEGNSGGNSSCVMKIGKNKPTMTNDD